MGTRLFLLEHSIDFYSDKDGNDEEEPAEDDEETEARELEQKRNKFIKSRTNFYPEPEPGTRFS